MCARTGDAVQPVPQFSAEVVEVEERGRQKEVFTNIAKRSWPDRDGMPSDESRTDARDHRTVIDNTLCRAFARDCRLHPIVKDLAPNAPNGLKTGDVATQHGWQALMHHEPRSDEAAVAASTMEDKPRRRRFIREDDMKLGKIDLRPLAPRCLEANLKALLARRPKLRKKSVSAV